MICLVDLCNGNKLSKNTSTSTSFCALHRYLLGIVVYELAAGEDG